MFPNTYFLPRLTEVDIKNGIQPGANWYLESSLSMEQMLICAFLEVGQECILAFLTLQINIIPDNQSLEVLLTASSHSKRAIQIIPLLLVLGVATGVGTGVGGIAISISYYQTLSKSLADNIEQVTRSLI